MKALAVLVLTVLGFVPQGPVLVRAATHELTKDQAVALVQRQFHARVVRADARNEGGHTVYVLRLLNDSGRVWTVHVDAESGAIR